MWAALALVAVIATAEPSISKTTTATTRSVGSTEVTTTNFRVYSFPNGPDAADVGRQCEQLRSETITKWLGVESTVDDWRPYCRIVLHRSRSSYANAVGRAAARTSGSSVIDFRHGRISVRRIDLLAERNEPALSALAHELTHVVLADHFGAKPPPAWADEGMATLADSDDKLQRHRRDLNNAIKSRQIIPLPELLSSEQYPSGGRWGAFYGQSVSLVGMLSERRPPDQFIGFVELGRQNGYDRALRDVYKIDGVAELERLWRTYLNESTQTLQEDPAYGE